MVANDSSLESRNIVNANPTKDFFITMLTRDIPLVRSIVDLVDNSVDAAHENGDISNNWVKIYIGKSKFIIEDNCGGMAEDIAKSQAFRFGRPDDAIHVQHSVGRFGVGMKRTLFKLGRHFVVTSNHRISSFKIEVDVDLWLAEKEWEFKLDILDSGGDYFGTYIEVDELLPSVSAQFELGSFVNTLREEIGAAHFKALNSGLKIRVNDELVEAINVTVKQSEILGVVGVKKEIDGVEVTIKAGIGSRKKHEAGWYVVCNGRLIEAAEQSSLTGWNSDGIPRYHPDYAYFRGVIDFECDDSDKLPWTTTKTGIDTDNVVYRSAKTEIQAVMRKILPFLKDRTVEQSNLDNEKISQSPLNDAINSADEVSIFDADFDTSFKGPDRTRPDSVPAETVVHYRIATEQLNIAKEALGASSASEVGRETFSYYMKHECDE